MGGHVESWLNSRGIDTALIYHYFSGGQINCIEEYRFWWLKNSQLYGLNCGSLKNFRPFKLFFDQFSQIKQENKIKNERLKEGPLATISHRGYEVIIFYLNEEIFAFDSTDSIINPGSSSSSVFTYISKHAKSLRQ
jgi:hypothetical protein